MQLFRLSLWNLWPMLLWQFYHVRMVAGGQVKHSKNVEQFESYPHEQCDFVLILYIGDLLSFFRIHEPHDIHLDFPMTYKK